jgi:prepilin-type N-terminal cleavage/methylation domain-containing protein
MNNEKGLTLLEVLAATAILGIVAVIVLNISGYSILATKKSDYKTNALRIAETIMNEKRKEYAGTLPLDSSWTDIESTVPDAGKTFRVYIQRSDLQNPVFAKASLGTGYVSIQAVQLFTFSSTPVPQPRLLTVTVSWEE